MVEVHKDETITISTRPKFTDEQRAEQNRLRVAKCRQKQRETKSDSKLTIAPVPSPTGLEWDAYVTKQLDSAGFVVIPDFISHPDAAQLRRAAEDAYFDAESTYRHSEPIFNGSGANRGGRRQSKGLPLAIMPLVRRLKDQLKARYSCVPCDPVILLSAENCGEQRAHLDYQLEELISQQGQRSSAMPGFAVAAFEDHTELVVWPDSPALCRAYAANKKVVPPTRLKRTVLRLPVGSVILCSALLVHAGAAYEKLNRRLHFFLDQWRARVHKDTYPIALRWAAKWMVTLGLNKLYDANFTLEELESFYPDGVPSKEIRRFLPTTRATFGRRPQSTRA